MLNLPRAMKKEPINTKIGKKAHTGVQTIEPGHQEGEKKNNKTKNNSKRRATEETESGEGLVFSRGCLLL